MPSAVSKQKACLLAKEESRGYHNTRPVGSNRSLDCVVRAAPAEPAQSFGITEGGQQLREGPCHWAVAIRCKSR